VPSRRQRIQDFYRPGTLLTEAAASEFSFRGEAIAQAVVARSDLNGYSTWARDKSAAQRAALLDEYFSAVVPLIALNGGVYFRDEGDCIVAMFSDYFGRAASFGAVRDYAFGVSGRAYGQATLTAKTTICVGQVAFFQKRHERGSDDWSAEGDPFVRAVRLEQAISSVQQVAMYKAEYDRYWAPIAYPWPIGSTGPHWSMSTENIQVSGLGAAGGWAEITRLEYRSS
jgi:class 3 adenylate cyclase